jgi:hypothetical protein
MTFIRWSEYLLIAGLLVGLAMPVVAAEEEEGKFRPRVYLTEEEAVDYQTQEGDRVEKTTFTLSDTDMKKLRKRQRVNIFTDEYTLYKIYRPDESEPYRYAIPIQQPGQHEYMDLMYGVNADGTINRIDLMVYREPYGGEVRSRRFMQQYEGRSLEDSEFRVNLDIIHIAGATISAKAVSSGTRKVLEMLHLEGYVSR